jgi:hypothetical protein
MLEEAERRADDPPTLSRTTLTLRKNNYGPTGAVTSLAFDGSRFTVETPPAPKAKSTRMSARQRVGLAALHKALAEAGEASPGGEIPADVRVVKVEAWRAAAYASGISQSDTDNAKRQAFYQARTQLQDRGLVTVSEPFAWVA